MENKHTQQVDFSNPNADKITSGVTNKPIKKETAIEWLIDKLMDEELLWVDGKPDNDYTLIDIIKKAKELEKEQMFVYTKDRQIIGEHSSKFFSEDFEQYYKETYEK